MRFFSLLVALLVFAGCNRDAADTAGNQGAFLAPATAPINTDTRSDVPANQKPIDDRQLAKSTSTEEQAAANEANGGRMTPEEVAAAKRMGPQRTTPTTGSPQPDAPRTAESTTAPSPVPASGGKPVIAYDRPLFTLDKLPCYGTCPTYSLTLTADRQLVLHAKKNMKKEGKYAIRLTAREYNDLLRGLDSLNLDAMKEVYPENIKMIPADARATILTFPNDAGEEQRMEVYFDAPEKLASFLTRFEAMVERKDWVKQAE